mmetsp:Transcript_8596/g.24580  ORF Transcript_8596/g.24580 Transcript_8596/m.24580 type:complete len:511 (-) Transcript_8596:139-1671(-)
MDGLTFGLVASLGPLLLFLGPLLVLKLPDVPLWERVLEVIDAEFPRVLRGLLRLGGGGGLGGLEVLLRHQAVVQGARDGVLLQVLPDEDELLPSVLELWAVKVLHDHLVRLGTLRGPLVLAHRGVKVAAAGELADRPGLAPLAAHVVPPREPEEALAAQDAAELAAHAIPLHLVHLPVFLRVRFQLLLALLALLALGRLGEDGEVVQHPFLDLLGVERGASPVHKAVDAVDLGLGHDLVPQVLQPPRGVGGLLHREELGVDDLVEGEVALVDPDHLCRGVQPLERVLDVVRYLLAHQVALAEPDHVGELDLLHQEGRHGAVVLLLRPTAVLEVLGQIRGRREVGVEGRAVHHGHRGVQAGHLVQGVLPPKGFPDLLQLPVRRRHGLLFLLLLGSLLLLAAALLPLARSDLHGESLRDLLRVAHPCGLHDDRVELLLVREVGQLLDQVLAESAADAPVVQLHHLRIALENLGVSHQVRVDVHLRHVIDQHGDLVLQAVRLMQDVPQQRRLA